ncbi:hypothetical protein XBKQ1_2790004 [Xenorhabdus bovienii str. kraussei Quebec]|uniref:Uncharacterized protein n=2 Tax=Xenorhabdus bovienii TaxID=40576 RepID=A0A077PJL1_XENBV|nr:hypothetical protein XBKQ1_2790004 [Xenorhabdus bovienii str. kraussei Quebec]CDH31700.1 hypothetical protein XBI1_1620023 [Xenorhabdus bovienii str. Intermedium]
MLSSYHDWLFLILIGFNPTLPIYNEQQSSIIDYIAFASDVLMPITIFSI